LDKSNLLIIQKVDVMKEEGVSAKVLMPCENNLGSISEKCGDSG
jgi:hypothetical protein